MRIGIMIDAQDGVSWAEWTALAKAAEEAGLYSFSLSEHYSQFHAGEGPTPDAMDAWTVIAALAPTTRTLRFGTLVSPVTFRHPSVLARVVATVDQISGGRAELGLGAGWVESEHVQNGFAYPDLPQRFSMLEEQAEIIVRSWTEDTFDFIGRHYTLRGQKARPQPLQKPHAPLMIGGNAKQRSVALSARFAQEYNVNFTTPDVCKERLEKVRAACAAIGRDPATITGSLFTVAVLGSSEDEVARRQRTAEWLTGNAAMKATWIIGDIDQAAARLREYERAGITRFYFKHADRSDFAAIGMMGELARAVA